MIQNRFSNSNFVVRKEGSVVATVSVAKLIEKSQSKNPCVPHAVLELGSVPLPVVTARIDRFIAEGGKGPYPDME